MPRITDAKNAPADKLLKKVWLLENLIHHDRTREAERLAAERMLARVLETAPKKGKLTDTGCGSVKAESAWTGYRLPEIRYGAKYEQVKGLSLKEIAKLIREDIKLARKVDAEVSSGSEIALIDPLTPLATMPKQIKVSVRSRYFIGGGAIDVRVYNLPEGWGFVRENNRFGQTWWAPSPALRSVLDALKEIHGWYNYDGSDPRVDHFNRNYYGSVEWDWREVPRD